MRKRNLTNAMHVAMPDLEQAFHDYRTSYSKGFRDAVESFIAAGVEAALVQDVLQAYDNNADMRDPDA